MVDVGFPNENGFLGSYKSDLPDFQCWGQPRSQEKYSIVHTYQYTMWYNVLLKYGKRDGKFCKTCLVILIKHKFKL